jgi:hypothetical protein
MEKSSENVLYETFFKNVGTRSDEAKSRQTDFAHYTTAETLIKIIEGRCIYLRNSKVLNDYSEIKFGHEYLRQCLNHPEGDDLFSALREINPIFTRQFLFDQCFNTLYRQIIENNTYIFSMTDHGKATSPLLGQLAMWRAYGGDNGVALIVDASKTAFVLSDAASALTFPVEYVEHDSEGIFNRNNWLTKEFQHMAALIRDNQDILRKIDHNVITDYLMQAFNMATVRSKHVAFQEENEWRIVRTVGWLDNVKAEMPKTETIKGVPQKVVKLNLVNHKDGNPNPLNLELGNIIKKILVGPCNHADTIRDAIIERLANAGIHNGRDLVTITNIPYRPNHR